MEIALNRKPNTRSREREENSKAIDYRTMKRWNQRTSTMPNKNVTFYPNDEQNIPKHFNKTIIESEK